MYVDLNQHIDYDGIVIVQESEKNRHSRPLER